MLRKPKYERSVYSSFCRTMFGVAGTLLMLSAALVAVFDPFYHYHRPLAQLGLRAVQTEKEYQVPGALRHFDYNAVLAGSSVVENNDNAWFDQAFGAKTIKAVRSYGGVADLCWYLDLAFASHNLVDKVFFNLDPAALIAAPETTFDAAGAPWYLYNENPFDDVKYLFNKTVLLEKIPYMIAQSRSGYDENLSYNWAEGKDFSQSGALSQYYRRRDTSQMKPVETYAEETRGNIALLVAEVEQHPDTQFYFFLPPYSALWWDDAIRAGERDACLWSEAQVIAALLPYENVKVYDFQAEEGIVANLDNYMDTVHFKPEINKVIVDALASDQDRVTIEDYQNAIEKTRLMSEQLQGTIIHRLEGQGLFQYE